jgi:hypothetical protein
MMGDYTECEVLQFGIFTELMYHYRGKIKMVSIKMYMYKMFV